MTPADGARSAGRRAAAAWLGPVDAPACAERRALLRAGPGLWLGLLATQGPGLGGCATRPPVAASAASLTLGGRIAVRVAGDAARSFSAQFELAGTEQAGSLDLTSPIGVRLARAEWSPGGVRLASSQGEREFADLESMTAEAFGEPLPLAALMAWLQGRPWAGAPSQPLAGSAGFVQMGWQVDLTRQAEGVTQAVRLGEPQVTVRVVADRG